MVLMNHNKKAVEEIKAAYEEGKKNIVYVSGVGTGKSFVFMGLMETVNVDKILYVLPKYAIKENILGYEDYENFIDKTDFVSYNYFNDFNKGMIKCEEYDFVVIDEAHHLGSDTYGKNLLAVMQRSDVKFLGLTATPVRDMDSVNVTDFFDVKVDGISNFEAIRQDLMPKFTYRICLPEKDLKQLEKEYDHTVNIKLNYNDCAEVLYDIATTYERRKWICFFKSIQAIEENMDMIKEIFEDYEIFILHSRLNNLKKVMAGIKKAEKAVVLSVNILLEGVHLSGVDAIALFRNVTSLSAFQQMLGRVCSIGKTVSPLIADCSTSGPKLLAKLLRENEKGYTRKKGGGGGVGKPIMDVGLGAHEAWIGIEALIEKVGNIKTPIEKEQELQANTLKAYGEYLKFRGNTDFDSLEDLMIIKKEYMKLKACADIHHVSSERLALYIIDTRKEVARG